MSWEIDACTSHQGFLVYRIIQLDIVRNIRDGYKQAESTTGFTVRNYTDSVVKISCIFSVDGYKIQITQITPS